MTELLILITAILFFFIGRWSIRLPKFKKREETIDEIIEKAREPRKPEIKPGVIPFKTEEDFEDEASGEKALDDHWRKSGIGKKVME